ncbi:dCTP deaminase domain-containing protein [Mesorhizobium muleiense]|uniref:dCTP deaminase domain-containing protein n=1 Tax=Mesorhizobium muleiense TaxID=1004279 RepID=UPI003AFAB198
MIGTLTDEDIAGYAERGELIVSDFEKSNIKQACYELRAGRVYYDLSQGDVPIKLEDCQYILVKPKQSVVIIVMEELDVPDDILCRVLTKGKLFSVGLHPVNTYADPGFKGRLGIVFYNSSNNYLKINKGESIAKIEFSKLHSPVKRAYSGQHGYETQIWPIPKDMILTKEEIRLDDRINKPLDELSKSYGENLTFYLSAFIRSGRYFVLAAILYFSMILLLIAMITNNTTLNTLWAVAAGLVANVLTAAGALWLGRGGGK